MAPAGALGAPGAQTPWSGALRDKKYIIVFPYKMPGTCAIGEFEASGAPGALTPWPIPHKKKSRVINILFPENYPKN